VTDEEAREHAERLEHLLERLEDLPPAARDAATEAAATLLALYGEALARIAARVPVDALAGDELVAHLLMVHGLHPVPVAERVEGALEEVRPYLRSHGGEVELLGVRDGVVRLRLRGSCSGCPASRTTLELAVDEAVRRAAPEIEAIEAEDGEPAAPAGLPLVMSAPAPAPAPRLPAAAFESCPLPMAPGGPR
jgi:Fe-S cluster biogenesis protein NfuA